MTASYKYLDDGPCAIPDAGGTFAPQFKDEFCFDAATGMREAPVVFRSRRREEALRKAAQTFGPRADFVPAYQWVARVIAFSSSMQRPSIGFEVRARGVALPGGGQPYRSVPGVKASSP